MQLDPGIVAKITGHWPVEIKEYLQYVADTERERDEYIAKYEQMVVDDKIHHDQIIALKETVQRASMSGEITVDHAEVVQLRIDLAEYKTKYKMAKRSIELLERVVCLFRTKKKIKKHHHWDHKDCKEIDLSK